MEKTIRILKLSFQPTKGGKDKWVVETASGNFSIWDSKLAEKLNAKTNQLVSVEVREAQEGTNYLPTITAMNDASDGTVAPSIPSIPAKATPIDPKDHVDRSYVDAPQDKIYTTTQRISAAVELKAAVEMCCEDPVAEKSPEDIGRYICNILPEIHAAHKLALSMQDE